MTKKHYIEIASILKSERNFGEHQPTVDAIAKELASFLKRDNARFDKSKFLTACGVEE